MDLYRKKEEADYRDFVQSFNLKKSGFVTRYFYRQGSNVPALREEIIQSYLSEKKKLTRTNTLTISILKKEANRRLKTLPAEIQPTIRNIAHDRARQRSNGNQSFRSMFKLFQHNKHDISHYYNDIIEYYVISTDITELKYYAREVKRVVRSTDAFPGDCPCSIILQWYNLLIPVVGRIRFKNEWFAVYYAMRNCLRPHSMHAFANMINVWFPACKTPCSYDSMADYNFLATLPAYDWTEAAIPVQTKATPTGINRIHGFLLANFPDPIDFCETHFLF